MKLYHLLLTSMLVANSPFANASILEDAKSSLKLCKTEKQTKSNDSCQILENAYQKMLELDQVETNQQKYIDSNVQMEMLFGGEKPAL